MQIFNKKIKKQKFGDLHEFSLITRTWNKVEAYGVCPSPRSFHVASVVDGKMLVLGGFSNKTYKIKFD